MNSLKVAFIIFFTLSMIVFSFICARVIYDKTEQKYTEYREQKYLANPDKYSHSEIHEWGKTTIAFTCGNGREYPNARKGKINIQYIDEISYETRKKVGLPLSCKPIEYVPYLKAKWLRLEYFRQHYFILGFETENEQGQSVVFQREPMTHQEKAVAFGKLKPAWWYILGLFFFTVLPCLIYILIFCLLYLVILMGVLIKDTFCTVIHKILRK